MYDVNEMNRGKREAISTQQVLEDSRISQYLGDAGL